MLSFGLIKSVARRVVGWVRSGVSRGRTAEEIAKAVEPIVGAQPSPEFGQLVYKVRVAQDKWTQISDIPLNHVISKEFSSVTPEFQRAAYRYNVHVWVENKTTGEAYKTWYTVESETLLTRQQIHDDVKDIEGLPTGTGEERVLDILDYEFLLRSDDE